MMVGDDISLCDGDMGMVENMVIVVMEVIEIEIVTVREIV